MTPSELGEVRLLASTLARSLREVSPVDASLGHLYGVNRLLPLLLAHADALAADNALLQALVNDAAAEGPSAALLAQAAAQEREACCKELCGWCEGGALAEWDEATCGWWHLKACDGKDVECAASVIRPRGLPPEAHAGE